MSQQRWERGWLLRLWMLLTAVWAWKMNEAYAEFFPTNKPARSMVRFGADIPGVLVAMDVIATTE